MALELHVTPDTDLLSVLAAATGSQLPLEDGKLTLPATLGSGYLQALNLGPLLHLSIYQCELKEDLRFRKSPGLTDNTTIMFSFRNLFRTGSAGSSPSPKEGPQPTGSLPAVRVSSADMNFELYAPARTQINTLLLAADTALFTHLLPPTEPNNLVRTLLAGGQAFLYEEIISPEMQAVAAQLVAAEAPPELRRYYLKVKAEELIYLFLAELLKRQHAPVYPLSVADAKQLYLVRDKLLADLSVPPSLPELAGFSGISESKLKRLFKQVFGTTVYTYYQTVRMQEAAQLLKEQRFTVSEVGNQLGFTNLGHFTRLFERYVGFKPKQYSTNVRAGVPAKAL